MSKCAHCSADVSETDAFCTHCGQTLSIQAPSRPRALKPGEFASTAAGRAVQAIEVQRLCRSASICLLAVAVLQSLGTALVTYIAFDSMDKEGNQFLFAIAAGLGVITALFFGLGLWARRSPLPASIVGLILFLSLWALDAAADPTGLIRGIIIKIIVVVVLARAIRAGILAKRLSEGRIAPVDS